MKLVSLTRGNEEITPLLADYIQRKYHVKDISTFISQPVEGVENKDALYEQWAQWIEEDQLENFMIDNPAIEETPSEPERPTLRAVPSAGETAQDTDNAPEEPPMAESGEAEEDLFRSHMEGAEALMEEAEPHEEAAIAEAMEEAREMEAALDEEPPAEAAQAAEATDRADAGMMAAMAAGDGAGEPTAGEDTTQAPSGEDDMMAAMAAGEAPAGEDTAQASAEDTPSQENTMPPETPAETIPPAATASPEGGVEGAIRTLVQAEIQGAMADMPQPEPPVSEDRIREIVREEVKALLRNLFS
ncbi:hypothetical protein CKO33_07790 [Ectothiorhodospira mobilis]|nr:hypothetical protein [Ectothiorhodospira mobilis]